jgi:hypothetical protein
VTVLGHSVPESELELVLSETAGSSLVDVILILIFQILPVSGTA